MSIHIERAQMLMSQGRNEMAEQELRQALVEDPNNAICHAMLAGCLIDQKKFAEATDEASQSIHLAPDMPYSHFIMGQVMYHRNRFAEAKTAATQAVQLNPYDADFFSLLSAIDLEQKNWKDGLAYAEQGLEVEPDHVRCLNLRAVALTKMGRTEEAGQGMDVALQNEPDNSHSHANQGWTRLHQGNPKEALVHFKEALRLDPDSEFARAGTLEAMKARNFIYRWLLKWFLFMATLPPKVQMLLVLGLVFGQGIVVSIAKAVPALEPVLPFLIFGYLGFVWMSWCGPMLFNLVLRFDSFGRMVLSPKERTQSTIVGIYLLVAAGWVCAGIVTGQLGFALQAIPFALALIPLNGTFAANSNIAFWIMVAVTAAATWYAVLACNPTVDTAAEFIMSIKISIYSTWASLFFIGTSGPKKL